MRHCFIRSEAEPALSEVEGDLQFCRLVLEMFFDRVRMQVEVKVCRAYGARTMLGNRCPSPGGLGRRLAVGPPGLETPTASSKTFPGRAC